ncbi:hypothetical protein BJF90_01425 [Pseudonocardia sp. CNS-004]|nr:hypothetical protein BJF90_01425 [Pseudonocardia sp. CNS-004]
MIETGTASARMTVTSVMLDDNGVLMSGHLLVLAESAGIAFRPYLGPGASHYVVDVLGPLPVAGAVLLAESTLAESTLTSGDARQVVCDTVIRHESVGLPIIAVVRHCTVPG